MNALVLEHLQAGRTDNVGIAARTCAQRQQPNKPKSSVHVFAPNLFSLSPTTLSYISA
jgi:hypothetical protein